ncbi:disease resistance protein L6-like [Macadamia integrifolia]|uniref:disease resistance protein L6-like n=1 Tax=Macadamia integrifolia TaxID=60698 RepID=UPI001C4FAC42|nr:disease resistance protein L6-like [Macadamia integrifolia]
MRKPLFHPLLHLLLVDGTTKFFLSFRGEDTRNSFTDHLYKALKDNGIHTFRDDDELKTGEEIGPELLAAIQKSKIAIPIFSKGYASSKWCLIEIAMIAECKKKGQIVLPIFYRVEPSVVRNQTGSFAEDFRKHERRFDDETVRRWREALAEVGKLKRWDLDKNRKFQNANFNENCSQLEISNYPA